MKAFVLEREQDAARRLSRYLVAAGLEPHIVTSPEALTQGAAEADLIVADALDGALLGRLTKENPTLRALMLSAEPMAECLRYVVENPQLSNICGRTNANSAPRGWELVMVLRRLFREPARVTQLGDFLDYGYGCFTVQPATVSELDHAVAQVQGLVDTLGVPRRLREGLAELTHEMLMNAMYDAPVGSDGAPKYAFNRKRAITLSDGEQPTFTCGTDGSFLVLQATDPYGRLQRKHVFAGLARGLAGGQMDQSHGGAGLGMMVCHNATSAMFFDVVRNRQTTVTGVFDLAVTMRDFRQGGKSLHYFESEG